jgi:hypothetical protein
MQHMPEASRVMLSAENYRYFNVDLNWIFAFCAVLVAKASYAIDLLFQDLLPAAVLQQRS